MNYLRYTETTTEDRIEALLDFMQVAHAQKRTGMRQYESLITACLDMAVGGITATWGNRINTKGSQKSRYTFYGEINSPITPDDDDETVNHFIDLCEKHYNDIEDRGVGLAAAPGDKYIVIDADTDAEVEAFITWFEDVTGLKCPAPGVLSPGVYDENTQEWTHKNGVHWWWIVPDDVNFTAETGITGALTVPFNGSSFAVKAGDNNFATLAGSRRDEGAYKVDADFVARYLDTDEHVDELVMPVTMIAALKDAQSKKEKPASSTSRKHKSTKHHAQQGGELFDANAVYADLDDWNERNPWGAVIDQVPEIDRANNPPGCGGTACFSFKWNGASNDVSGVIHTQGCAETSVGDCIVIHSETALSALSIENSNGGRRISKAKFVDIYRYHAPDDGALSRAFFEGEGIADDPAYVARMKKKAEKTDHPERLDNGEGKKSKDKSKKKKSDNGDTETKKRSALEKFDDLVQWLEERFTYVVNSSNLNLYKQVNSPILVDRRYINGAILDDYRDHMTDASERKQSIERLEHRSKKKQDNPADITYRRARIERETDDGDTDIVQYIQATPDTFIMLDYLQERWDIVSENKVDDDVFMATYDALKDIETITPDALAGREKQAWKELWDLLNVSDDAARVALVSAVCAHILADQIDENPIIIFEGESASGKTVAAQTLANFIDPNFSITSVPSDRAELERAIASQNVSIWDNLNYRDITEKHSDAFAKVVSGGQYSAFKKYTDMEKLTLELGARTQLLTWTDFNRPRLLPDFINRALFIELDINNRATKLMSKRQRQKQVQKSTKNAQALIYQLTVMANGRVINDGGAYPIPDIAAGRRMASYTQVVQAVEEILLEWGVIDAPVGAVQFIDAQQEKLKESGASVLSEWLAYGCKRNEYHGTASEIYEDISADLMKQYRKGIEDYASLPNARALKNLIDKEKTFISRFWRIEEEKRPKKGNLYTMTRKATEDINLDPVDDDTVAGLEEAYLVDADTKE